MVGVVRDVVIPVKGDPVFTIVCEILTTPAPEEEKPHTTRLWKVSCRDTSSPQHPAATSRQYMLKTADTMGQMASAWRVISFFVVVFVLPTVLISLPLYARYHLYHARNVPMTETDTRALNHAVSSFWCQGQRVTSNGTLDAFKVAGLPRLQEKRRHVTLKRNLTLRHDDIEYWGVYLLEGSSFALTSSARWPGGVLLVVQGEENLRKCFYRENRLEEELNGNKPAMNNVYKSPYDVETHPVTMEEERHWEEEDVGGEVFDDDDHESISKVKVGEKEIQLEDGDDEDDDDLDDLLPGLSDDKIHRHHKYDIVEKVANAPMRKNGKGKKIKNGKSTKRNKKEIQHRRPSRPRDVERVRRDTPDSPASTVGPETTTLLKKLDILHMFNDTLSVQTGNSSFSSSEEFLEQCRDSILTVDLSPYIDWQTQVSVMNTSSPDYWTFNINASDYYYFIFTSDNSIELNHLGFNLELERKTYDVSSALESCLNSSDCVFPLAFAQTEAVVVEVLAAEDLRELHSFEVITTCQPRVPVYMVFILLVPFIILLFAFQ